MQFIYKNLNTSDYTYLLPPEKIAFHPLPRRDASKLLVYNKGKILHASFSLLPEYLPDNAFLFFNDTKVIPARLHFKKESGATIEIFLLNPLLPSPLLSETMAAKHTCRWQCTIGNLKKWPEDALLQKRTAAGSLTARLLDRAAGIVELSWPGDETFAEIIRSTGETPLPPYIKRKTEETDSERYQTIYSHTEGAVAAPTAGLHFTPAVFAELDKRNIGRDFVTLHVSAGTFQPIKTEDPERHVMHEEQIIVSRKNVENLLADDRIITAVGTTSLRTLESLYWFGAKLKADPEAEFNIGQNDPYTMADAPAADALAHVLRHMDAHQMDHLVGKTSLYIRPGYRFRVCQGLITNFHQPGSTLILLVAAFVGEDWRTIYQQALDNNYRFLSYGDSSILFPVRSSRQG